MVKVVVSDAIFTNQAGHGCHLSVQEKKEFESKVLAERYADEQRRKGLSARLVKDE